MYTDRGGLLTVVPELGTMVVAGEVVATLHNAWGDLVRRYKAREDSVVIGKSTNPAAGAGSRIIHLGVVGMPA
jgi:predicted deacylase